MAAGTPTYPVATIAKLLLISERRVQQLTQEGVIPKSERGRYELAPAVQGYIRFLQDRMAGHPDGSDAGRDYQLERVRKVRAEASLAEIRIAQAQGSWVPVAEVQREWTDIAQTIRSRMLAIPSRMGQLFGTPTTMEMGALDREIREALTELARGDG